MQSQGDVTRLLAEVQGGNARAGEELLPEVYQELRALAHHFMCAEGPGHTLQTTALIHEAWLRLTGEKHPNWNNRTHFLRVAARAMRRVLVDHARARRSQKRTARGRRSQTPPEDLESPYRQTYGDLLDLDEALKELTAVDEQAGQVFELRFFGGLTARETATVLDISPRTVLRDWKLAKSWLAHAIAAPV